MNKKTTKILKVTSIELLRLFVLIFSTILVVLSYFDDTITLIGTDEKITYKGTKQALDKLMEPYIEEIKAA